MMSEYSINLIAQYVIYGLIRARMMTSADIESSILDLEFTLKDLFTSPADSPGISEVENRRNIALVLVGKLTAMRRIEVFRYVDRMKWSDCILRAVQVVEVELVNAEDEINRK